MSLPGFKILRTYKRPLSVLDGDGVGAFGDELPSLGAPGPARRACPLQNDSGDSRDVGCPVKAAIIPRPCARRAYSLIQAIRIWPRGRYRAFFRSPRAGIQGRFPVGVFDGPVKVDSEDAPCQGAKAYACRIGLDKRPRSMVGHAAFAGC